MLPVIGTKELVAWLPSLLGLAAGDLVVYPSVAYPTYAVGALLAGCQAIACDDLAGLGDARPALVWLNSPSNPTGQVLDPGTLAARVRWARERGALVAADECYGEFGWEAEPVSVLHPSVSDGDYGGLLAVHSLSKRSNLAGYRAGFVAGDPASGRRVAGGPQACGHDGAPAGPAGDDRVAGRPGACRPSSGSGTGRGGRSYGRRWRRPASRIEHSQGSIYLWATRGEDGWASVDFLAGLGILVAPGDFYGPAAAQHIRVALTAPDERIAAASSRLVSVGGRHGDHPR